MSHFSGVLQLTDLDDFITPSQVNKWEKVHFHFSMIYHCYPKVIHLWNILYTIILIISCEIMYENALLFNALYETTLNIQLKSS